MAVLGRRRKVLLHIDQFIASIERFIRTEDLTVGESNRFAVALGPRPFGVAPNGRSPVRNSPAPLHGVYGQTNQKTVTIEMTRDDDRVSRV